MLHPSKSQSILQWFNSMITKGAIQSLSQFSDGLHFYDIVTTINSLKKGKNPDASVNSSDDLIKDSNVSVVSATPATTETESTSVEKDAEANNSATEMNVDDDTKEIQKENETNVPVSEEDAVDSSHKTKEAEIEKRYEAIKEFLDDFFTMDSTALITYLECIKGKELELAKVAVLLLSAMVQSFLSSHNDQLYTTTLLDLQVQEDIKECLSLVLEASIEDGPLKKTELQKILSRPSKSKGTPRRKTPSRGTTEAMETPDNSKSVPKKRKDRASVLAEEIFESPLKNLLESPKIQFKAAMFQKDAELYKLRDALDAEETKVIDLTIEKRSLNAELEKKKRELGFLKEEHRKLQECAYEVDDIKKMKIEETLAEKERVNKIIHNLKEEMEILKKENENLHTEIAHLEEKLSRKGTEEIDYKKMYADLMETVKELELNVSIKDGKIKDLKQKVAINEEDAKNYWQMYEDVTKSKKTKPKTSPKVYENVSNIIYADDCSARDMLAVREKELNAVRKELATATEKATKFEKRFKGADNDRKAALDNVRSVQLKLSTLQSDFDSLKKQISIYENWANCMGNSGANLSMNSEACGNPASVSSGIWPSTSSQASEQERNVKEEPGSAKLWENFSGKSMETRSRSAVALGYHRDSSEADSSLVCSESQFQFLKKVARAIAKLFKKKCDASEAEQLNRLEDQARSLSSIKDLCEFYQSILESLKSMKTALVPLVSELPTKRKCRYQAAEETDPNVICLIAQNKTLETELEGIKQEMNKLQKEFKAQLEVKVLEVKAAEDKRRELEIGIKLLNDNLEKSQQEAADANKKYEFTRKSLEKMNTENRRLVKLLKLMKDEAGPKVEPCNDCEQFRERLTDVIQDKKDFERDAGELKALVQDLECKNRNLDRQLKIEVKERKKLEFRIQRESAFLSGNMSERNAVIHRYFQQGLAESKRAEERKSRIDKPQQVVSFNTFILNQDNKDPCPENSISNNFANRSIRSGFLQTDDEEDFLNHSSLAQIHREVFPVHDPDDKNRLTEIQRRNTLCLPHLQSSYPLELQNMTPTERKYFDKMRAPVQPSESEERSHVEFVIDSEDSQDVQNLPLKKRKGSVIEKTVQPVKRIARSSSQAKLIKKVKPVTPVRKTGFISKTKSFKTPTSIRRLMRMPHRIKQQ